MGLGFNVIRSGIVTTPTVQVLVQKWKARAGIVITSSHNPVEWNGLKFIDEDGLFLSPERCKRMFEIAETQSFTKPLNISYGKIVKEKNANKKHLDSIFELEYIKPEEVRKRKFKVVVDTINGAGGPIMKELLERFGCEVITMNYETTGLFKRNPEPIPEHLSEICEVVKKNGADIGLATDPDVDRCVIINEKGEPLGEEYTLALAVHFILGVVGRKGNICKNLSSSRAIDDIAKKYGCNVINTPVGEIHVAKKMQEVNAIIGGEGNGGVMLPDIHIGRDAPVAAALILQLLSGFQGTISELKNTLPKYEIVKLKADVPPHFEEGLIILKKQFEGKGTMTEIDGLRIDTEEGWIHIRKSNTEPVYRVIGEFGSSLEQSKLKCQKLIDDFAEICKNIK
eukprot:TRINITY_DN4215_c0_g4_i1.p1 TRINITY_DN4215_c0_g4~~TRINITY_DN4215_c0_g4_i1.p1  ORF type:complete len:397 (-),score=119.22 TRINITY_DN4215_c0_g4_i1:49-1239(-)